MGILPEYMAAAGALYARNLELSPDLMDDLAHRTDGASPAFIKEFLRTAPPRLGHAGERDQGDR